MKQKIILCVLAIALLASCAKATLPVPTMPPATKTLTPTIIATATKAPTSTITPLPTLLSHPLPTDTVPTVTVPPDPKIIKNCVPISDQETALHDISTGTIIFHPKGEKYTLAQNLETGKEYKLPAEKYDKSYNYLAVSPDRSKLAYSEINFDSVSGRIDRTILWIINAQGDVLQKVTFDYGLYRLRWLDNERIIFYIWETYKNGRVLMVNPFAHQQHYVWNDLPNLYSGGVFWWITWFVEYSPNLEWVVYYGAGKRHEGGGWGTIVRNIVSNKNIWEGPIHDYGDIAWSPDGKEVAITTYKSIITEWDRKGNLIIIDHEGVTKPVFDENQPNLPAKPSWSPDGRYIAFWNDHAAMLYDKQTDSVLDFCIDDEENVHWMPPLWSPNSQQFVVQGNLNHGTATSILIDVQKNEAHILSKTDYYPSAWMNSLP